MPIETPLEGDLNLTGWVMTPADMNIQRLAVGCMYVLLDRALLDFPGSDSAHPSPFVLVNYGTKGLISDRDRVYFPFRVRGNLWQEVVVPVLKDPENQIRTKAIYNDTLRNADKQGWLENGDYDRIISQLSAALTRGMQEKGFLPPAPPVEPPPPPAPGEPVVYPVPGAPFPDPDGTVVWPEGHLRLTYPVVN